MSSEPGKNKNKVYVLVLVLAIILLSVVLYRQWPDCTKIDSVDTSVKVKTIAGRALLGFNTDTDSLKFGVISPGGSVKRKIIAKYTYAANVTVSAEGEMGRWLTATPATFFLPTNTEQEVVFDLNVPVTAADGSYAGKVVFCFSKKA